MTDFKVDNNNIIFIKAVEKLRLRFPIAEISRKTGYSEGQISRMLKNKIPTSDKFLDKFFASFNLNKEDFSNYTYSSPDHNLSEPNEEIVKLKKNKEYIDHYENLLDKVNGRIKELEVSAGEIDGYKELSELIKLKAEIQKELDSV